LPNSVFRPKNLKVRNSVAFPAENAPRNKTILIKKLKTHVQGRKRTKINFEVTAPNSDISKNAENGEKSTQGNSENPQFKRMDTKAFDGSLIQSRNRRGSIAHVINSRVNVRKAVSIFKRAMLNRRGK
jgi:hypothetical protein